jgi:hypothetical protein
LQKYSPVTSDISIVLIEEVLTFAENILEECEADSCPLLLRNARDDSDTYPLNVCYGKILTTRIMR